MRSIALVMASVTMFALASSAGVVVSFDDFGTERISSGRFLAAVVVGDLVTIDLRTSNPRAFVPTDGVTDNRLLDATGVRSIPSIARASGSTFPSSRRFRRQDAQAKDPEIAASTVASTVGTHRSESSSGTPRRPGEARFGTNPSPTFGNVVGLAGGVTVQARNAAETRKGSGNHPEPFLVSALTSD